MAGRGVKRWALLPAVLLGLALAQAQPPAEQVAPADPVPADAAPSDGAPANTAPQEGASVQLTRKADDGTERVIRIVRTGLTDDTGIFVACTPQDSDPAGSPTLSVFSESGPGGIQVTVDKNLIRAPLAIVTQQEGGDGHIEMSAGTAQFLDNVPEGKTDRLSRCAVEADPKPAPDTVFVTQGRTSLKGQSLVYDESDGIARIAGPITFTRAPEAGKPASDALNGNSDRIEVNVDKETTTLAGNVTLKNGTRTSSADRVDYDDAANVAILRGAAGAPAVSVDGTDTIRAPVLRYNLERNTVIAIRSDDTPITGEFQDGEPDTPAGNPSSAPQPNQTPNAVPGAIPAPNQPLPAAPGDVPAAPVPDVPPQFPSNS